MQRGHFKFSQCLQTIGNLLVAFISYLDRTLFRIKTGFQYDFLLVLGGIYMYRMQSVSVPEKKLLLLVWQFSSKTIFRNQSGKPQNTIYSDHDEWWWGSSRSTVKKGKLHWIQNMWTNQLNSTITKKYFNFLQVDHCVFGNIARGSTDHIAWVKLGNYSRSHNALQFTGTHVCAIVNNQQWAAKANRGYIL